ncbi:hypothetical protein HA402_000491 [Bradysia odoriphaga]|nr:hypothetical protein HA402_000491 [Bradysia odoriphaga]
MDFFAVGDEFDDFISITQKKKEYEAATNTLLTICNSHLLKGDGEFQKKMKYDRFQLGCKAGTERPTASKGLLEQKKEVEKLVALGANKYRMKSHLLKNGTEVTLKYLHNIQTKQQQTVKQFTQESELAQLLEELQKIPGSKIRVFTNDENELIGIFFQDERMMECFEHFPELILFDGSYKLNNRDMPLVTQLAVDGNGESEIISIYVCQSESRESIGSMIEAFQEFNPAWERTKVILGDKDFADRSICQEMFPHAELQICLFNVLRIFNREITAAKRNISAVQRVQALQILEKILEKLVYARSHEDYNDFYQQLLDLGLDEVTKYFDNNWHNIREEWTLFGRNQHSNYLNDTNNRSESLNQKIKMISSRAKVWANFLKTCSLPYP